MQTQTLIHAFILLDNLALAGPVIAEDHVVREYSFDLSDIREVEFSASVGSMRIVPTDGTELSIVLEIEGNDEGWFRDTKDVDDVELESEVRGDRLLLEQTEDDTNTEWTIRLPVVAITTIELGVGEINAELGATELSINLGVGDVDVAIPAASTGRVDLSVGVGDARLRGASDVSTDRMLVTQEIRGQGDGDMDMTVELGVGDVAVTLL